MMKLQFIKPAYRLFTLHIQMDSGNPFQVGEIVWIVKIVWNVEIVKMAKIVERVGFVIKYLRCLGVFLSLTAA